MARYVTLQQYKETESRQLSCEVRLRDNGQVRLWLNGAMPA